MSIEKLNYTTLKHQRIPYAIISNEVIQNITNHVAGFIWVYLQTLPEHWEVNKWHIMKHFNISESTYKRHMKYLKDNKLVRYEQARNSKGEFTENHLVVCNGEDFLAHIRGVKNDPTAPQCQNTASGKMNPHINTIINTNKNNKYIYKSEPEISEKNEVVPVEYQETYFPLSDTKKNANNLKISNVSDLPDNPHNIPIESLESWLETRKQKKCPVTPRVWKLINTELSKCKNPLAAFDTMVLRGWASIKAEWIAKENGLHDAQKKDGFYDYDNTEWVKRINDPSTF